MLSELDARRTDHSPVSGRTVPLIGRCPERVHTRTSCCVLRLPYYATSAVALPYSRAPTPCHPTPWRARAVHACKWQCNTSMLPGTKSAKASVHQQSRPARRDFWPRIVAMATWDYGRPGSSLSPVLHAWSGLVFAGLAWSGYYHTLYSAFLPVLLIPGLGRGAHRTR